MLSSIARARLWSPEERHETDAALAAMRSFRCGLPSRRVRRAKIAAGGFGPSRNPAAPARTPARRFRLRPRLRELARAGDAHTACGAAPRVRAILDVARATAAST